jgi:hypothetical protein
VRTIPGQPSACRGAVLVQNRAGPPPNSRERYNAASTQSLLTVLRDPEDGPEIDGRRLEALR